MGKRKYFIISLLLIISAILSDFESKVYFSKSSQLLAESLVMSDTDKAQVKIQREKIFYKGQIFLYVGVCLAVMSFAFWFASEVHHEPVWRLILPALMIMYVLVHLTMV